MDGDAIMNINNNTGSNTSSPLKEPLPSVAPLAEDEVGEYFFESDPLALKSNPDYHEIMKALFRLEAQRAKAVMDLEKLEDVRDKSMNDPMGFVTSLQNGENLNLPAPQDIVQIPHIDWEKYNVKSIMQTMRPKTRKRILQESLQSQYTPQEVKEPSNNGDGKYIVRGRAYDESKPQTFNQAWSEEEQRKLEELLIKYPDEPIASHRWVKISKELGTRTSLQVQSRVQKYFIALKREKLPVPGRAPRINLIRRPGYRRKGLNHSNSTVRSSIFMKAFHMEDEDALASASHSLADMYKEMKPEPWDVSDEEDITEEIRESEEYQELLRLKQVRKMKLQEEESGVITHYGFACDVCEKNPIEGVRWHCIECPSTTSTDVCEKCVKTSFTNEWHQTTHILQPVRSFSIRDSLDNPIQSI